MILKYQFIGAFNDVAFSCFTFLIVKDHEMLFDLSLRLGHDTVKCPSKKINTGDDVTEALHAAGKLNNQHNGSGIQRILKLLQSVVPKSGLRTVTSKNSHKKEPIRTCAVPHSHKI